MDLIKLTWRHAKPYWPWMLLVVILQTVQALTALYLPTLNADIIDKGVAKGDLDTVYNLGGWMLLVALGNIVAIVIANYCAARTAMSVGKDLRSNVFNHIRDYSSRELNQFGSATLITRSTNDVQQVQMLVFFTLNILIQAPITGIGGVIMALKQQADMAWIIAVMVPILLAAIGLILVKAIPLFKSMQKKTDRINQVLREQITGIRVLRAFTREAFESARYDDANRDLTEVNRRVGLLMILLNPIIMFVLNMSSVLVIWVAAPKIDAGTMDVGSITAFISYLIQILISVMMATFMTMMIPRAAVAADRITEVLATETSVVLPKQPVTEVNEHASLEFRNVSFTYPGAEKPVLDGINFKAGAGQTIAIIGGTGAGKTTLLNLIARLLDATTGEVLVDGVNVKDLDPEFLWKRIAMVPQRPYLFSGTVASTIRFGNPDASDQEIWEALTVAQGRDFVAAMPKQLESPITQGGTNVSGGQRQRLCIARALAVKPEIYLFDDSFSALDLTTEAKLRSALGPYTADALTVVVAQRVSTITSADLILVLDHGRVVGAGTHQELLAGNETYQEIVSSQGAQEDVA